MTTLLGFITLYLLASIGIGLLAATRVKNARDFAVAGRMLPLPVVTATVFATWFGAEAVLGVSATFVKDGLQGVVADPFGASMCLLLAGFFFASKLYRLNLLTIGDYYRLRYNHTVEWLSTLAIVVSYLGWVSAQIKALGLVFFTVTGGLIPEDKGMILGAAIVLTYTVLGGMLSVAILDFVQITVIMGGLIYIATIISDLAGGVGTVISHASAAGKLDFLPSGSYEVWVPFIGAWMTMMLGSIPQQDVFQRITSAKNERVAMTGSILGGSLYFVFAFIPMFLAYSATLIDPVMFEQLLQTDSQLVLPTLILQHTPIFAQVIFFGALLSAIMSCSSATLLAPSVSFTENILRPMLPHVSDRIFLWLMRIVIVAFAGMVLAMALTSNASIFKMVEHAYKITLVVAFVPLVAGFYWQRATTQGALFAIFAGFFTWILCEMLGADNGVWPPQILGLLAAIIGMLAGSLLPQRVGRLSPPPSHHHAAEITYHVTHPDHERKHAREHDAR
ncbi:MAG: sodium:solute symporter [Rhodocyclaceae bacterium]|jgi:Na+/proline symporter|nr:sodium:solute symporter [Rhodocyclaceae bacterium]